MARFAAAEAPEAIKSTRQPTRYLAKEMGVVREAKEMASPRVAEIPVSLSLPVLFYSVSVPLQQNI